MGGTLASFPVADCVTLGEALQLWVSGVWEKEANAILFLQGFAEQRLKGPRVRLLWPGDIVRRSAALQRPVLLLLPPPRQEHSKPWSRGSQSVGCDPWVTGVS